MTDPKLTPSDALAALQAMTKVCPMCLGMGGIVTDCTECENQGSVLPVPPRP